MDQQSNFHDFESLFWQVSRKVEYLWKAYYAQTFPGSQSRIVYMLEQNGPMKMSELAASLHITPGAVTTAANLLIENGYIIRIHNEQDRRVIHLDLTEKGRETLNELQNEGRQIMEVVFKGASDEDLERMQTLFKLALNNIDNL